jgi:hypothetical protein
LASADEDTIIIFIVFEYRQEFAARAGTKREATVRSFEKLFSQSKARNVGDEQVRFWTSDGIIHFITASRSMTCTSITRTCTGVDTINRVE